MLFSQKQRLGFTTPWNFTRWVHQKDNGQRDLEHLQVVHKMMAQVCDLTVSHQPLPMTVHMHGRPADAMHDHACEGSQQPLSVTLQGASRCHLWLHKRRAKSCCPQPHREPVAALRPLGSSQQLRGEQPSPATAWGAATALWLWEEQLLPFTAWLATRPSAAASGPTQLDT